MTKFELDIPLTSFNFHEKKNNNTSQTKNTVKRELQRDNPWF